MRQDGHALCLQASKAWHDVLVRSEASEGKMSPLLIILKSFLTQNQPCLSQDTDLRHWGSNQRNFLEIYRWSYPGLDRICPGEAASRVLRQEDRFLTCYFTRQFRHYYEVGGAYLTFTMFLSVAMGLSSALVYDDNTIIALWSSTAVVWSSPSSSWCSPSTLSTSGPYLSWERVRSYPLQVLYRKRWRAEDLHLHEQCAQGEERDRRRR